MGRRGGGRGRGGRGIGDSARGDFEPDYFFNIFFNICQHLIRHLSGKILCRRLVFIDFDVIMASNKLTSSCFFFSEKEKSHFKMKKITFLIVNCVFVAYISAPLIVLITFRLISVLS